MVTPADRRTAVTLAMTTAEVSERRACRFMGFARASQRYASRRPARTELRARLVTLATLRPRWGYRRPYVLLRREGWLQMIAAAGERAADCACRTFPHIRLARR